MPDRPHGHLSSRSTWQRPMQSLCSDSKAPMPSEGCPVLFMTQASKNPWSDARMAVVTLETGLLGIRGEWEG